VNDRIAKWNEEGRIMRRRHWRLAVLYGIALAVIAHLGLGTAVAQQNVNPAFNFDGIEAFWEIVAVLESDTEPTASQWDAFFEAPGYKRLSGEFGRDYFMSALRTVFLPSDSGSVERMVSDYAERGGFLGWYTPLVLEGFQDASRDRDWQSQRVQELKTYPYLEKAAEYALQYLPEDAVGEYPAVDFVVFSDSRGYTPLILGIAGDDTPPPEQLACLREQGLDRHFPFTLLMAHESFHMYRGMVEDIKFPENDHPDYPILWTLDQMVNEGIGDLINRKRLFYGDGCLATSEEGIRLQHEQLAQPATIRVMDRIFSEMADAPELTDVLGQEFQGFIPQSGHPTGFYMADLIEEELGIEELKRVVRNPFGFFALYNRAADVDGEAPRFSDRTLTYLESLEAKYRKD
jgi:hypothetical protein